MAFETSVLRDGAWVTETVDFQAALKASVHPGNTEDSIFGDRPPCGILSRTVVGSPVVNWVHSVRLRSKSKNDIAFIGDRYVQISELRSNGQLHDVLRVNDFGARIRNAVVFGSCPIPNDGTDNSTSFGIDDDVKLELPSQSERLSIDMRDDDGPGLPPQLLVLTLETGEVIFSFIQSNPITNAPTFVTSKVSPPPNAPFVGYHLAIDPSSRYLAVASLDDTLVLHYLKSWQELNEEFKQKRCITPVLDTFVRIVSGNIQNLAFLYPQPEDEDHIILIMIVCPRKQQLVVQPSWLLFAYDWERGENVLDVFARPKPATRLPDFPEFPCLLIPLKFHNAFFVICQLFIGLVKQALSVPEYEFTMLHAPGPSKLYHGVDEPLWTAWARPFRRESYSQVTDIIYLAREDGFIEHLELDAGTLMHSATDVGYLNTNIPRAFTTAYNGFSDLLIIGGDSGPGGIWKLEAREEPEMIMSISNWSPVVDAVTNDTNTSWIASSPPNRSADRHRTREAPDRIFLASGRGATGNVTEVRHGVQARIGLDLELGEPLRQAWLFSDDRMESGSMVAILALPYSTAILSFSSNLGDVAAEPAEKTPFDTSSRTLHSARIVSGIIVQITEETITLVTHSQSSQHKLKELCDAPEYIPQKAFSAHQHIVLSSSLQQGSQLRVLRVEDMNVVLANCWDTPGENTCVFLLQTSGEYLILLGEMIDGLPSMAIYSLEGNLVTRQTVPGNSVNSQNSQSSLEALTSIVVVEEHPDYFIAIAGTRCGHLITFQVSHTDKRPTSWTVERFGTTSVEVFPPSSSEGVRVAASFACCDNNAVQLTKFCHDEIRFKSKTTIWPTDMSDSSLQVPPIHSVFGVGSFQGENANYSMLVMVAGTRMLLADLSDHASLIPRNMPVAGTPTRIIYSNLWKCLVVAYQAGDKPSLAFIDANTGTAISRAIDRDRNTIEFINGLGQDDDRIFGLQEWIYIKDGQTFPFIIVTTQSGNLLIISVREEKNREEGSPRELQYWTRYRKKGFKEPIYSVVSDEEGLIYCAGQTLYWDVLDLVEKKMKSVKSFELDSPAISLSISNGKVWALTSMHSLEIIDHRSNPDSFEMKLLHTDQVTRHSSHMVNLGPTTESDLWPVTLLSDITGGIAGLWVPWDQRDQELVVVFEGKVGNSVRRFMRARCRPTWLLEEQGQQRYGLLRSTTDGAEILGVSLDGSLRHFTLLRQDLRRFLYLVQSLWKAKQTSRFGQSQGQLKTLLQVAELPKNMHIDGDILSICLNQHLLENLVQENDCIDLFCKYIDEIEGGQHTAGFGRIDTVDDVDSMDLGLGADLQRKYMKLGYDILEYVLAPVL